MSQKIRNVQEIECRRCGVCCNHPCALHPDDLPKIAQFLKISEKELFRKYLILDYWIGSDGNEFYLCTARQDGHSGEVADFGWAFSSAPCIFLKGKNECTIHPVKPLGARECNPISEKECDSLFKKKKAADAWKGKFPQYIQDLI